MSSNNANDKKLVKWLFLLLLLPLGLAYFSRHHFRYPCQNPANWEKEICKMPLCDVTRDCPEHIFKGQRDPRLGPPKDEPNKVPNPAGTNAFIAPFSAPAPTEEKNCGK
jgi:hypothetical protein